jgi:hypothetical protein
VNKRRARPRFNPPTNTPVAKLRMPERRSDPPMEGKRGPC